MKQESLSGKHVIVKKNGKFYKISTKDIKSIKMRVKKMRPPVPNFNKNHWNQDVETEDGSILGEDSQIE